MWHCMQARVKQRLKNCGVCATHNRRPGHGPVGEMPLADYPMHVLYMDLIGPMMESPRGSRYALTILDHCTRWLEVYPLKDKTNKSVWNAFAEKFIPQHGVPEVCITDKGGEFIAGPFQDYLHSLGIEHRITPGHPQSNGSSERANRFIKELLAKVCKGND